MVQQSASTKICYDTKACMTVTGKGERIIDQLVLVFVLLVRSFFLTIPAFFFFCDELLRVGDDG